MKKSPILEVKNLSVVFKTKKRQINAVKDISFSLKPAQTLALVGESGSGKSVTALSILKLLPYPLAKHPSGSIIFSGNNLLTANNHFLRDIRGNRISMIFQEPMTSLNPLHTVEKQISETLTIHNVIDKSKIKDKIIELLHLVNLYDHEQFISKYPHQLSGGQRQRIMIAMAIACQPDILIADEPTTALDVTVQAQILDLLKNLQKRFHMSILLITHNLEIVSKIANEVAVMHKGKIVEVGTLNKVFKAPKHQYTKFLLESGPKGTAIPTIKTTPVIMKVQNLQIKFPIHTGIFRRTTGYLTVIKDISFSIRAGNTIGILGESGAGKTTLAFALLKLQKSNGKIIFLGKEIQNLSPRKIRPLRQHMQIVFQDPFGSLSPRLSISEIISEGIKIHKTVNKMEEYELIKNTLEKVGLDPEVMYRYPHELSGGQRQRIALARVLVLKPSLLILDEPTSALDRAVQSEILDLLKNLQSQYNLAYIFISHDLKVIKSISHEIIVINKGVVVEKGPTESIFQNPKNPYTKQLLDAAFNIVSSS